MQKGVFALILVVTATLMAQELPPPFPRTNATRLFENDRINVWDIVWPKGQPTALHRHIYDQVGTYYQRGGRVITTADGEKRSSMTEVVRRGREHRSTTQGGVHRAQAGEAEWSDSRRGRRCGFPARGCQASAGRRPRHHVGLCLVGARIRSSEISSGTRDGHRLARRRLAAGHAIRGCDDDCAGPLRDEAAPRSRLRRRA